ncbi:MAG: LysM peptidoglycan-binding domain-containing protein, partial [Gammaproteobacteria bacterium]
MIIPPETQQRRQKNITPAVTITPQQETRITYTDVWDRIRDNLVLERHTDRQAVKIKINWFRNNQDYLHRVAERATPYLHYIVEELERRNMPLDLALLPVIESAYQPFAYSRSHASGIWQFIPGTGRMYGLKQNWWYDGRRDIVAGTRAALDYLQKLSDQFDGDWQLALAGYNAGENRIERAIRNNKRQNKDTDFFSLSLPRETRGYIPSLLAVAEIVSQPEKYDLTLSPIPNQPYFSIVDIGDQLDLATAASLTDLTIDDIYTLNPGFNYWATDPDGPHYLLVPIEREQQFIQGLSALPKEERVGWKRHVIKQGETLSHIADQYRTSITAIKQTNNLRSNLIRTGQSLMIPGSKQPGQFYTLSRDNRRFAGLKREGTGEKYIYTVRSGDSLWTIGRRYGVSVRDLTGWNGINSNSILRPGQKLSLWVPGSTPSNRTASTSGNANAEYSVNEEGHVHYTVQKGDSLWLISRQFGVSVSQLQEWNKLPNGKPLQPGQLLVLLNAPQLAANSG